MVLGLAMLGVGANLFYGAFGKTVELRDGINTQTQNQLNALLDDGSIVVIPQKYLDGKRGDVSQFTIGITNIHPERKNMSVHVTYGGSSAYSGGGLLDDPFYPFDLLTVGDFRLSCSYDEGPESCGDSWVMMIPGTENFILDPNDRKFFPIGINIPKDKKVIGGQYVFNVDICIVEYGMSDCTIEGMTGNKRITQSSRYDSRHKVVVKV